MKIYGSAQWEMEFIGLMAQNLIIFNILKTKFLIGELSTNLSLISYKIKRVIFGLALSTSTHFDQVQNHITDDIIFSMMEIFGLLPETTVFVISMEKHLQVSG